MSLRCVNCEGGISVIESSTSLLILINKKIDERYWGVWHQLIFFGPLTYAKGCDELDASPLASLPFRGGFITDELFMCAYVVVKS